MCSKCSLPEEAVITVVCDVGVLTAQEVASFELGKTSHNRVFSWILKNEKFDPRRKAFWQEGTVGAYMLTSVTSRSIPEKCREVEACS